MKRMPRFCGFFISTLLLAILTSCGEPTATPLPTATQTPVPTAVPTATPVPTATSVPTATPGPFPGLAEWDLLMINDSFFHKGIANSYAKLIEADMHVKVNVHDCSMPSLNAYSALQMLQNNMGSCETGKQWADLVKEAEVIVVFANPEDSLPTDGSWTGNASLLGCARLSASVKGLDAEAAATYKANVVKSCSADTFALYKTHLGALYDKILELHAGSPVIIRTSDYHFPTFSFWQAAGVEDCCTTCWEALSTAIHQAATEHKVLIGSSFIALNGQDHRTDPSKLGYVISGGYSLTELGAQRVAQALQQTGYAYTTK